jgi:hypothetical protein
MRLEQGYIVYETDRMCLLALVEYGRGSTRASKMSAVLRKHGG